MSVPRLVVVCVIASLGAGALGGAVMTRYSQYSAIYTEYTPAVANAVLGSATGTLVQLRKEEWQTIDVVRQASPAVVSIVITKQIAARAPDSFFDDLFSDRFVYTPQAPSTSSTTSTAELPKQRLRIGGGSGFLVAANGYIVTNKHVVEDEKAEYTVVLQDGREFPGKVLATDPSLDLAIIKIDGTNFPYVPLGDSDKIAIGQTVIAIGNALAEFQNTVTKGIVSGVDRRLVAGTRASAEVIEGAIQTDAAINPGNSGGPLIDLQGNVIGVNTAISENAQSLGFALPINVVKQAVESVKRTGKIVRPWIGVRYIQIDANVALQEKLAQNYGVLIQAGESATEPAVIAGSPAAKAGLKVNDVILEVSGQKLDSSHSLSSLVTRYAPGDKVGLKISRAGKEQLIDLTLEERTQ